MYKHITIYTLFLLLLIACGSSERGRMMAVLDEADSLNRNYIPFTTDSVLKEATEWFDSYGSANERVRAHYLLGCAYRDMGEAPAALQCYHDAINCADTTATDCDYRLLSRVHGQMGNLFYEMNLPYEQKSVLNNAIKYSLLSGDTLVSIICYETLYNVYHYLGMEDSCLAILLNSRQLYLMHGYNREAAICAGNIISTLVEQGKFIQARSYIDIYEKESGMFRNNEISEGKEIYYYIKGRYYLGVEKTDSAELMFRRLLESGKDINDKEAAFYGLSLLYKKLHNNDSVAKYSLKAYDANDKQKRNSIEIEMQQMQSQYDYTRHQQLALEKTRENIIIRYKLHISMFVFCIFILLILFFIYNKRKERLEERKRYEQTISTISQANMELSLLNKRRYEDLKNEKERQIINLKQQIELFRKGIGKRNIQSVIPLSMTSSDIYIRFKQIGTSIDKVPTQEEWNELQQTFEKTFPDFKNVLLSYGYMPTDEEYLYCILIKLHFEPFELIRIFNTSNSNVSNIRARLATKIFKTYTSAKKFDTIIQRL